MSPSRSLSRKALYQLRAVKANATKAHRPYTNGGRIRDITTPKPVITLRRADYERQK